MGVTTEVSGSRDIWWPGESQILALWPFTEFLPIPNVSSVQLLSPVRLFATPWTEACQISLSITNSWSSNSCPNTNSLTQ